MLHAVGRGEVVIRLAAGNATQQLVQPGVSRVSHKHRPGLGVERLEVGDAVVLLGGSRELVFANGVVAVLGATRHRHKAKLAVFAHDLPVKIIVRPVVRTQRALGDEAVEVFAGLRVDARVGGIGALGQVNLGPADVQKTAWPPLGHLSCLSGGHDVVREFTDLGRTPGSGQKGWEGLDDRHWHGTVREHLAKRDEKTR